MLHLRDVFITCFHTDEVLNHTHFVLLQFPLTVKKTCYSCELVKRQTSFENQ